MGGGMPSGGRSFHFSTSGGDGGFSSGDPMNIFSEFFKQGGANMGDDDDIFSQFAGGSSRFGRGGGTSRGSRKESYGGRRRERTPEVTTVERPLAVTLEELYRGTHKKMKIKRKTFDPRSGKRNVEDKILDMDVKPGYKSGTKIKFKGVGDQEEGGTQDLHFIVTEVRLPPFSPSSPKLHNPTNPLPPLETPLHIHPLRRRPHRPHHPRPQRSANRLVPHHHHHRRPPTGRFARGAHEPGVQRDVSAAGVAEE